MPSTWPGIGTLIRVWRVIWSADTVPGAFSLSVLSEQARTKKLGGALTAVSS